MPKVSNSMFEWNIGKRKCLYISTLLVHWKWSEFNLASLLCFSLLSPVAWIVYPLNIVRFNMGDKNSKNVPSSITKCEKWNDVNVFSWNHDLHINWRIFFRILFSINRKSSLGLVFDVYTLCLAFKGRWYDHIPECDYFFLRNIYECNHSARWFIDEEEKIKVECCGHAVLEMMAKPRATNAWSLANTTTLIR